MRLDDAASSWRSRCGLVAGLAIAVDLALHGVLLSRGFFGQDDFLVMNDVASSGAGGVLDIDHTGGFAPGAALLAWLTGTVAPLDWGVAIVPILAFRTAAIVALWPLVTRLLGDRWIRLVPLVLFALTPLALWVTQWWWLGLRYWPATFALVVASWAVVARFQDGRRWLDVVVPLAVAVGLCFSPMAVLDPLVLVGLVVMVAPGETLGHRARSALALRRAWIGTAMVVAAYIVVRAVVAPVSVDGVDAGDIVVDHIRYVAALAWGGPWTGDVVGHAALVAPTRSVAVGGALLLALVGLTAQRGPAARAAWLLLLVHTLGCAAGVVVLSGANAFAALAVIPRVGAETAPVLALCLAGALTTLQPGAVGARGVRLLGAPGRADAVVAGVASVAFAASAGASTYVLAPSLFHEEARDYVTTLRRDLRDAPRTVVYDGRVPADVVDPIFGERARVSQVIGTAPERPVFDVPSARLRTVDADGALVDPVLLVAATDSHAADPAGPCGHPVRAAGAEIDLSSSLGAERWIVRIGYFTSVESFVDLAAAGRTAGFAVSPGLGAVYVQLDVPAGSTLDALGMTLAGDGTLCVTDVEVGRPDDPAP